MNCTSKAVACTDRTRRTGARPNESSKKNIRQGDGTFFWLPYQVIRSRIFHLRLRKTGSRSQRVCPGKMFGS
jgi:hypothetical protein